MSCGVFGFVLGWGFFCVVCGFGVFCVGFFFVFFLCFLFFFPGFFCKEKIQKSNGIFWFTVPGVVKKVRGKVIINIYIQQTFTKEQ